LRERPRIAMDTTLLVLQYMALRPEQAIEWVERLSSTCCRFGGTISYQIADPTNTCDPYTGNWCEHLIDFGWLERTVRSAGFCQVKILAGFYSLILEL